MKARRIVLYVAPAWKARAYATIAGMSVSGAVDMGGAMKALMADANLRTRGAEVQDLVKRAAPEISRLGKEELNVRAVPFDERAYLSAAKRFLADELRAIADVFDADAKRLDDPKGRAKSAVPWRPAIYVE